MSAISFAARVFAVCIATLMWVVVVLPIWIFMLLREVSISAFYAVATNFGAASKTYDAKRLDIVSAFWVKGLKNIFELLSEGENTSDTLSQEAFSRLLCESALAIFFYLSFAWLPGIIFIGFKYMNRAGDSFNNFVPDLIAPFIALFFVLAIIWSVSVGMKKVFS